MSFWAKVGVKITDLAMFKECCKKHDVNYERNEDKNLQFNGNPVHAVLTDSRGGSRAYLVREKGAFRLALDTDAAWSTLTRRLGNNGGVLMRDYSTGVVKKGITAAGGMVTETVEQPDGSIILKAASM